MRVEAKIVELEETTFTDDETKQTSVAYNVYLRLTHENKAMCQITATLKQPHIQAGMLYMFEHLEGKIVYVNLGLMNNERGGRIWFFPSMVQGGPNPILSLDNPSSKPISFDAPSDFPLPSKIDNDGHTVSSDLPEPKTSKGKDSSWLSGAKS